MKIGVIGLGLIGGSMAGALKRAGHEVFGFDSNKSILNFAVIAGSIAGELTEEDLKACDSVVIAVKPKVAIEWLKDNSKKIRPGALVFDCCGVKSEICKEGFRLAEEGGFNFIGGHPMAGKQVGGFKNSSPDLFENSLFAMVPKDKNDIRLLTELKSLLQEAGFTKFSVMTPDEHDKVVAFTSQMAHLISNAYIKSDMANVADGAKVSGGAFRDMTRVAYLDETMWTELFMANRDNLLSELGGFIGELERYKEAIERGDEESLMALLAEGKARKEEIEGNK